MDATVGTSPARRAALRHLAISLLLVAPAVALAPAKFERAGALLAILTLALLLGGAACAYAAWAARARHGVQVPGWSPFARDWWAWDPPLRGFHYAMCAHVLWATWGLVLASVVFEAATGSKVPVALDRIRDGLGEHLTGVGAAVLVAVVGYALTVAWARRVPA